MIYKDLCDDIAALGFESEFDSQERLLSAIRRALMLIYTERPMYGTLEIFKPEISPSEKIDDFSHKGGNTDAFPFNARAYTFRTDGIGKYKIVESDKEKIFEFSQNSELHRGFLHGEGRIEFIGEYSYSVYDFGFFDEIYGQDVSALPTLSGYKEYRVKDYADDFLSFVFAPTDGNGTTITDSSVRSFPRSNASKEITGIKRSPNSFSLNFFVNLPFMITSPLSYLSKPPIMFSSVDFPTFGIPIIAAKPDL